MLSCRWPRIPPSSEQQITAEPIDLMFVDDNHPIAACVVPCLQSHFKALGKRGRLLVKGGCSQSFFKTGSVPKRSIGGYTGETALARSARQRQRSGEVFPRLEIRLGQGRASGRLASFHPRRRPTKT